MSDHEVHGHEATAAGRERLRIVALDRPGPGGAHHTYEITLRGDGHPAQNPGAFVRWIEFQRAPLPGTDAYGLTNEVLLAIVADRLRAFQRGPLNCAENSVALQNVEDALTALHMRTRDRQRRGVEGAAHYGRSAENADA